MRESGLRFVEVIKKLLMRLLEYRTIIHDENKDNRMNCIVNLLVCTCNIVKMGTVHSWILRSYVGQRGSLFDIEVF